MIWADPVFKHAESIRLPHSADRYVCGRGGGGRHPGCGQLSSSPGLLLFAGLSRSLVLTLATCIVPGSQGGERSYLSQPSLSRFQDPLLCCGRLHHLLQTRSSSSSWQSCSKHLPCLCPAQPPTYRWQGCEALPPGQHGV